ncbi:MAG: TerB family tellurite resistance protein [Terricaulis sp.]
MRFGLLILALLVSSAPALAQGAQPADRGPTAPLALLVLIIAVILWLTLRSIVRSWRARKTEVTVQGNFNEFALQALVNAAKIDGRIAETEISTIAAAMKEIGGSDVSAAFSNAKLTKDELVAYLTKKANVFTNDQKQWLLKSLLAVFVADGKFDEVEHAALVDYTAAIGFDRARAPDMLRNLARDFSRGNIT